MAGTGPLLPPWRRWRGFLGMEQQCGHIATTHRKQKEEVLHLRLKSIWTRWSRAPSASMSYYSWWIVGRTMDQVARTPCSNSLLPSRNGTLNHQRSPGSATLGSWLGSHGTTERGGKRKVHTQGRWLVHGGRSWGCEATGERAGAAAADEPRSGEDWKKQKISALWSRRLCDGAWVIGP
jgi:hypothetical protein